MSMRMSISVSLIIPYFYLHEEEATQHLETMEWIKFLRRTIGRSSGVQTNTPHFFKQKCHFLNGSVLFFQRLYPLQNLTVRVLSFYTLCFFVKDFYKMLLVVIYYKFFQIKQCTFHLKTLQNYCFSVVYFALVIDEDYQAICRMICILSSIFKRQCFRKV